MYIDNARFSQIARSHSFFLLTARDIFPTRYISEMGLRFMKIGNFYLQSFEYGVKGRQMQ